MSYRKAKTRREFLACSGIAAAGVLTSGLRSEAATDLDAFIKAKMERDHIPGLAVAIIRNRQKVLAKGLK